MLCELCNQRDATITWSTEQHNPDGTTASSASQRLCRGCFDQMVAADPELAEQLRTAEQTATTIPISTTTITETRTAYPRIYKQRENPYVIYAFLRCILARVGFGPAPWKVNWSDTMTDVVARFFVGLVIGAGVCFLLVPTFFWPSKHAPRNVPAAKRGFYANFPDLVPKIFLIVLGTIVIGCVATTRATVSGTEDFLEGFE